MRYKAILFDMDGTVLDTLQDLYDSVNTALSKFNMPIISLEETRRYLGNGSGRLIASSVPAGTDREEVAAVLEWYQAYYTEHCQIKTAPYAGIIEMMQSLTSAGLLLAVISNKPDNAVQELARTFFSGLLCVSVGERENVRRKPAPDTVLAAVRAMGVEREECVYVGDSEVDVETARNAGIDCISVTWGFRTKAELVQAGADTIADSVQELLALLLD